MVFDEMGHALERGESVKLTGFGNFQLRDKAERPGRNPKTGEQVSIAARRVVTYQPSQKLKSIVDPVTMAKGIDRTTALVDANKRITEAPRGRRYRRTAVDGQFDAYALSNSAGAQMTWEGLCQRWDYVKHLCGHGAYDKRQVRGRFFQTWALDQETDPMRKAELIEAVGSGSVATWRHFNPSTSTENAISRPRQPGIR